MAITADELTAQDLYDVVLRVSNQFLHNCKLFSIEILRLENPTYAQVATVMRKTAAIITALADDVDPMLGQKAFEYCELMHQIGVAIDANDQIALARYMRELDRRPGV